MNRFAESPQFQLTAAQTQLELIDYCHEARLIEDGFKTIDDLKEEIRRGESRLAFTVGENGEQSLARILDVAGISVYYMRGQKPQTLYELVQVNHRTGIARARSELLTSLAEKLQLGETPDDAAVRALKEELNLVRTSPLIFEGVTTLTRASNSFRGIDSYYCIHIFHAEVGEPEYRPNIVHPDDPFLSQTPYAYVETQTGRKSNYYAWRE